MTQVVQVHADPNNRYRDFLNSIVGILMPVYSHRFLAMFAFGQGHSEHI